MKARAFPIIYTAILLLIACKKEEPYSDKEYPNWPAVKTLEATNADSLTVKLNGTVNGYGLSTTVIFEYGTTTDYGSTVTAIQSPVRGDSLTHVSADISRLTPCTIYHFRIKADNSKWINFYSSDITFTTRYFNGSAITRQAKDISHGEATLTGVVYSHNLPAFVHFEYHFGHNGGIWNSVTAKPRLVTADSITTVSARINLRDNGAYPGCIYRVVVGNSCGVVYGDQISFIY